MLIEGTDISHILHSGLLYFSNKMLVQHTRLPLPLTLSCHSYIVKSVAYSFTGLTYVDSQDWEKKEMLNLTIDLKQMFWQTTHIGRNWMNYFHKSGCGTHDEATYCPKMWWPHTAASRRIDLLCWRAVSESTGVRQGCCLTTLVFSYSVGVVLIPQQLQCSLLCIPPEPWLWSRPMYPVAGP